MDGFHGHLNNKQQAALNEMKHMYRDIDDHTLLRFLRARKFNVQTTKELYDNYVVYRRESGVENILNSKLPNVDVYNRLFPHAYHGFDKMGRPIYIEKLGAVDFNTVGQHLTEQELMTHHIYKVEKQIQRCKEGSRRRGQVVDQLTTIVDLKGLNMTHRKAISFMRLMANHDSIYNPERLGKCLLVNAPWVFPWFWKICSAFLDENTTSKIDVLGKNYKQELLKYVDADQLPKEYGGTCVCVNESNGHNKEESGCVPKANIDDLRNPSELKELDTDDAVEVYVGRRDTFEKEWLAPDGGIFDWCWKTIAHDIKFTLEVIPLEVDSGKNNRLSLPRDNSMQKLLMNGVRCDHNRGSYTSRRPCIFRLKWDNTFSRFHSKTVKYIATVSPFSIDDNDDDDDTKQADLPSSTYVLETPRAD